MNRPAPMGALAGERFYLGSRWGHNFDGRVRGCRRLGAVRLLPHNVEPILWVAVDPPLPGLPDREWEEANLERGSSASSYDGPTRPKASEVLLQEDLGGSPHISDEDPIPVHIFRILNPEAVRAGAIDIHDTLPMGGGLAVRLPELLPTLLPERRFNEMFGLLCQFAFRHGHTQVPNDHRENGELLGEWVAQMKRAGRPNRRAAPLDRRWLQALESVPGWSWE